jgi:hypothetical protein
MKKIQRKFLINNDGVEIIRSRRKLKKMFENGLIECSAWDVTGIDLRKYVKGGWELPASCIRIVGFDGDEEICSK